MRCTARARTDSAGRHTIGHGLFYGELKTQPQGYRPESIWDTDIAMSEKPMVLGDLLSHPRYGMLANHLLYTEKMPLVSRILVGYADGVVVIMIYNHSWQEYRARRSRVYKKK